MNEIVNKLVLAGDKCIPEMHLIHPVFPYSACRPFTKNKERIKKSKETEHSRYNYQSQVAKACFQHDMAYGDFKGLKVLIKYYEIKAFNIAKNPNYNRYQRGLASMVYNFFDKKTSGGAIKKETMANEELTKELSQPIIRKF